MNKKTMLERTVIVFGVVVISGAIWFYSIQVGDTLEILRLAYPD